MKFSDVFRPALAGLLCLIVVSPDLRHAAGGEARAFVRDGLWRVVHNLCAPMQKNVGLPLPCLKVDAARGFAILRSPADSVHVIVAPTEKVEGIESPKLFQDNIGGVWAYAWAHRQLIAAASGRPLAWSDLGMAINSSATRTQDQLHIHLDCVDPRLKAALEKTSLSRERWTNLDLRPWADSYRARRIEAAQLRSNLFAMIAKEIPHAASHMADQTMAVVGFGPESGAGGLVVLENSRGGHAEQVLDHDCARRLSEARTGTGLDRRR